MELLRGAKKGALGDEVKKGIGAEVIYSGRSRSLERSHSLNLGHDQRYL